MDHDDDRTAVQRPRRRRGDTLVEGRAGSADSAPGSGRGLVIDASPRALDELDYGARYAVRKALGQGGMGEVNLCVDQLIGREVAVKVMLPDAVEKTRARERFLREARVQAQLEHPGVVPVYDMGVTPTGAPYFAMKRVRGTTLQDVIKGLRSGDRVLTARYPRRALLSVIERVAETMAYAHNRGVVHRDLKPANIMLGDYGEVSILDWGIAKLSTDSDLGHPANDDASIDADLTVPGSVVGTPGYMAPEQATGDEVSAASDVYSLGAILFEVVTLERLHQGSRSERIGSTITGVAARPSAVDPEVPAAIDAICAKATATLPKARYQSAREMLVAMRAFLDGERVSELRREVAGKHVEAARSSLSAPVGSDEKVRARALRELGAAVVLDPGNAEMIQMIERLLAPEGELPEDLELQLEKARARDAKQAAGRSALVYAIGMAGLPLIAWMGVRDMPLFVFMCGAILTSLGVAIFMWRSGRLAAGPLLWAAVPLSFVMLSLFSAIFGPFVVVPTLAVVGAVALTISVRAERALRHLIVGSACLAIAVPFGLQLAGVLPASYRFAEGTLEILPHLTAFPELPTMMLLGGSSIFLVLAGTSLVGRAVDSVLRAERRLALQAHRLRSMLPQTD